jgi:hypothetical protein
MAKCEQGYLCEVCGEEVSQIEESDLYLRFILREIPVGQLLSAPERHLRCNPVVSQFIVDQEFEPIYAEGPWDKRGLDREFVSQEERRVTRGWRRLQEVKSLGLPLNQYPLEE